MLEARKTEHTIEIETTADLAFEAMTKASELREWFSDEAWTEVRPGGRYEVRWSQGYRAEGKFTAIEPPHRAAFTWRGTGEPGETLVEVTVEPRDGAVGVSVVHGGFEQGDAWDHALEQAKKGWNIGLENLKSTLETGVDLRLARQPFLGIYLEPLDRERAAKEGIAVEQGIYVTDTAENSGARAAGLGKGDVIVALGGMETLDHNELTAALRAHHAGDTVTVELVRGQKRETVQVTLGERPREDLPHTADGLAQRLAERYAETDAELKAALEGVTEEEAERAPAEGEWSVKQILAHLSIVERDTQSYLASVALDGWVDSGPSNPTIIPGRLAAVLTITPTLAGLLERYLADEAETVAFLRGLPEETTRHKARFYRLGQMVHYQPGHTREHIEQIRKTTQAIREGS